MNNGIQFVKGQKVISPFGTASVVEVTGDQVTVHLENGEEKTVAADELEDDNDAG
jgi:sRNA-binding protein